MNENFCVIMLSVNLKFRNLLKKYLLLNLFSVDELKYSYFYYTYLKGENH